MNPLLKVAAAVERLVKEYRKHGTLIIAFDFDDSVFYFHAAVFDFDVNSENHRVVLDLLRKCKERGFPLMLFTAGVPDRYEFMLEYCRNQGIEPNGINKNVVEGIKYGHWGKPYWNILLDDRAGLPAAVETLELFFATIDTDQHVTA